MNTPLKAHHKDVLVTLGNAQYIDQVKQVFASAYWNGGWDGDYVLLGYELSEKDAEWFINKGIQVKHCNALFSEQIGFSHQSVFAKYELFGPEFSQWERVIFLDGDVTVQASLLPLKKLSGFWASPVANQVRSSFRFQFIDDRNVTNEALFKQLEQTYDLNRSAFNSGLMAWEPKDIPTDTVQRMKEMTLEYKRIIHISEEAVLNMFFYDSWNELSLMYNFCPLYEKWLRRCSIPELRTAILHPYSERARRSQKIWDPKSEFYPLWEYSFKRANQIDITQPQPATYEKTPLSLSEEHDMIVALWQEKREY